MLKGPKLTTSQWKLLSSAVSNISQAIILFSLAALFAPEAVNLSKEFSRLVALIYLACGLILFLGAIIIAKRGDS